MAYNPAGWVNHPSYLLTGPPVMPLPPGAPPPMHMMNTMPPTSVRQNHPNMSIPPPYTQSSHLPMDPNMLQQNQQSLPVMPNPFKPQTLMANTSPTPLFRPPRTNTPPRNQTAHSLNQVYVQPQPQVLQQLSNKLVPASSPGWVHVSSGVHSAPQYTIPTTSVPVSQPPVSKITSGYSGNTKRSMSQPETSVLTNPTKKELRSRMLSEPAYQQEMPLAASFQDESTKADQETDLTEVLHRRFAARLQDGAKEATDEKVLSLFISLSGSERKLVLQHGSIRAFLATCPYIHVTGSKLSLIEDRYEDALLTQQLAASEKENTPVHEERCDEAVTDVAESNYECNTVQESDVFVDKLGNHQDYCDEDQSNDISKHVQYEYKKAEDALESHNSTPNMSINLSCIKDNQVPLDINSPEFFPSATPRDTLNVKSSPLTAIAAGDNLSANVPKPNEVAEGSSLRAESAAFYPGDIPMTSSPFHHVHAAQSPLHHVAVTENQPSPLVQSREYLTRTDSPGLTTESDVVGGKSSHLTPNAPTFHPRTRHISGGSQEYPFDQNTLQGPSHTSISSTQQQNNHEPFSEFKKDEQFSRSIWENTPPPKPQRFFNELTGDPMKDYAKHEWSRAIEHTSESVLILPKSCASKACQTSVSGAAGYKKPSRGVNTEHTLCLSPREMQEGYSQYKEEVHLLLFLLGLDKLYQMMGTEQTRTVPANVNFMSPEEKASMSEKTLALQMILRQLSKQLDTYSHVMEQIQIVCGGQKKRPKRLSESEQARGSLKHNISDKSADKSIPDISPAKYKPPAPPVEIEQSTVNNEIDKSKVKPAEYKGPSLPLEEHQTPDVQKPTRTIVTTEHKDKLGEYQPPHPALEAQDAEQIQQASIKKVTLKSEKSAEYKSPTPPVDSQDDVVQPEPVKSVTLIPKNIETVKEAITERTAQVEEKDKIKEGKTDKAKNVSVQNTETKESTPKDVETSSDLKVDEDDADVVCESKKEGKRSEPKGKKKKNKKNKKRKASEGEINVKSVSADKPSPAAPVIDNDVDDCPDHWDDSYSSLKLTPSTKPHIPDGEISERPALMISSQSSADDTQESIASHYGSQAEDTPVTNPADKCDPDTQPVTSEMNNDNDVEEDKDSSAVKSDVYLPPIPDSNLSSDVPANTINDNAMPENSNNDSAMPDNCNSISADESTIPVTSGSTTLIDPMFAATLGHSMTDAPPMSSMAGVPADTTMGGLSAAGMSHVPVGVAGMFPQATPMGMPGYMGMGQQPCLSEGDGQLLQMMMLTLLQTNPAFSANPGLLQLTAMQHLMAMKQLQAQTAGHSGLPALPGLETPSQPTPAAPTTIVPPTSVLSTYVPSTPVQSVSKPSRLPKTAGVAMSTSIQSLSPAGSSVSGDAAPVDTASKAGGTSLPHGQEDATAVLNSDWKSMTTPQAKTRIRNESETYIPVCDENSKPKCPVQEEKSEPKLPAPHDKHIQKTRLISENSDYSSRSASPPLHRNNNKPNCANTKKRSKVDELCDFPELYHSDSDNDIKYSGRTASAGDGSHVTPRSVIISPGGGIKISRENPTAQSESNTHISKKKCTNPASSVTTSLSKSKYVSVLPSGDLRNVITKKGKSSVREEKEAKDTNPFSASADAEWMTAKSKHGQKSKRAQPIKETRKVQVKPWNKADKTQVKQFDAFNPNIQLANSFKFTGEPDTQADEDNSDWDDEADQYPGQFQWGK